MCYIQFLRVKMAAYGELNTIFDQCLRLIGKGGAVKVGYIIKWTFFTAPKKLFSSRAKRGKAAVVQRFVYSTDKHLRLLEDY